MARITHAGTLVGGAPHCVSCGARLEGSLSLPPLCRPAWGSLTGGRAHLLGLVLVPAGARLSREQSLLSRSALPLLPCTDPARRRVPHGPDRGGAVSPRVHHRRSSH